MVWIQQKVPRWSCLWEFLALNLSWEGYIVTLNSSGTSEESLSIDVSRIQQMCQSSPTFQTTSGLLIVSGVSLMIRHQSLQWFSRGALLWKFRSNSTVNTHHWNVWIYMGKARNWCYYQHFRCTTGGWTSLVTLDQILTLNFQKPSGGPPVNSELHLKQIRRFEGDSNLWFSQ